MSKKKINPELKNIVEAALLVAGQPLTIDRMLAMFPADAQPAREEIREALKHIEEDCAERGVELKQIDKGWRIQTREKYASFVARLLEERPPRYSRALLETLAIIVYRQPVTRGEIEDIRGVVVSTDIVRTLVEREWIKQVGVREVPGRPALYGTTRAFLEHFNLKSLEDMPPLAELRSIEEIGMELDRRVMPTGAVHGADRTADAEEKTSAMEAPAARTAVEAGTGESSAAGGAITERESAPVVGAQPAARE